MRSCKPIIVSFYRLHRRNFTRKFSQDPFTTRPQPIPLGDREAQRVLQGPRGQFSSVAETLAEHGEVGFEREPDPNIDEAGRNKLTGEINGPKGREPTRFGDWERKGRVSDF